MKRSSAWKNITGAALLLIISACSAENQPSDNQSEMFIRPGRCHDDYTSRVTEHLKGIQLNNYDAHPDLLTIYFNDLSLLPIEMFDLIRQQDRYSININNTTITDFPEWSHLEGVAAPGWGGKTYDLVPGTGVRHGIYLGNNRGHITFALANHEFAHSLDFILNINGSAEMDRLYHDSAWFGEDPFLTYRFGNKLEFFAVAFDEYYCSHLTRNKLKNQYPLVYDFFETRLMAIVRDAL